MTCGNPLYLEWIGEWMERARENNSNSYYFYRKAYDSMAKYPTRFTHPSEAMCLTGIGEKTVIKLEKKLEEYCKDNNLPMPIVPGLRRPRAVDRVEDHQAEEPAPKRARPKATKEYVPAYRSGAYGILLALLDARTPNSDGAMTKHEITAQGQIYCDSSLTNPEHGKFYTAWSSINTLMSKGLVYKSGTKYYLTGEGLATAERMRAIDIEGGYNDTTPTASQETLPLATTAQVSASASVPISVPARQAIRNGKAREQLPAVASTSSASTSSPSSHASSSRSASYRDKFPLDYEKTLRPPTHTWTDSVASRSNTSAVRSAGVSSSNGYTAFKGNKDEPVSILSDSEGDSDPAETRSTNATLSSALDRGFSITTAGSNALPKPQSSGASSGVRQAPTTYKVPKAPPQKATVSKTTATSKSVRSVKVTPPAMSIESTSALSTSSAMADMALSSIRSSSALRSTSSTEIPPSDVAAGPRYDPFPHLKDETLRTAAIEPGASASTSPSNIASLAAFRPVIYEPGSFEICLVLDIREVRTQTDRDYIGQKLKERGINVIKRALDIGDVIWIARLKEPVFGKPDELVLDYVVERKRMDDLVSSIKDGRFLEQKFRLRRSGLDHIIYLIETHRIGETYEIGPDAIRTSMTSTQVQDGFFVRRTNNTDQTIDYFVSITKALNRLYESETLYGIPDTVVNRTTYLDLQAHLQETVPERSYLTSYKAFGLLNGKSETVLVKDAFVKMLMTIRGVGPEKAMELARVYGTPRALFSMLDEASDTISDAQRRKMLVRKNSSVGSRKIGPALSAKVVDVWYSEEYNA
ncbi:Crossover junction endonuclease mus81 [Dissophora globulifera]|nr:Crossover junction endonuclease mus81 [Dissophora globulifera]